MENRFQIIRAVQDDIDSIRKMANIAFRHTYREILSPEQMEYMMDWMYSADNLKKQMDQGHVFYLAKEGENFCGYMSIEAQGLDPQGTSIFHLHKIYILPDWQGKGLGRFLLDRAVDFIRAGSDGSAARLELNVNRYNKAIGFYRHYGMRVLQEGDFHIGHGYYMNDYIMGLDLQVRKSPRTVQEFQ